jgi:hypothetical protein
VHLYSVISFKKLVATPSRKRVIFEGMFCGVKNK